MDRDIPVYNPVIVGKIQQKQLEMHQNRINRIQNSQYSRFSISSMNNNRNNKKSSQLEEQKKTQIQKKNLILFNKMMKIMKRKDPCNKPPPVIPKNNRALSQFSKIQEENRTMYDRIQKQKPTIDTKKLYQERKKTLNILKFLGKYSSHSLQNANSIRISQNINREQYKQHNYYPESIKIDSALQMMKNRYINQIDSHQQQVQKQQKLPFQRSRRGYSVSEGTRRQTIQNKQDSKLPLKNSMQNVPKSAKDIILFKKVKQINKKEYEITIVRRHNNYEIRGKIPNSQHILQPIILDQNEGNQLLQQVNYNYYDLIDKLTVNKNKLQFKDQINYKEQQPSIYQQQKYKIPPRPTKNNFNKFFNPSHISQQNIQQSVGVNYNKPNNIDSLGSQQLQSKQQSSRFQQKFQQLLNQNNEQQYNRLQTQKQEKLKENKQTTNTKRQLIFPNPIIAGCQMQGYQESLDENVL